MQNGKSLKVNPYFLILNSVSNKLLRTGYGVIQSGRPLNMNHIAVIPEKWWANSPD